MFRYIQARVLSRELAEDLTSEVFLLAVKGIDSYGYRGQPILAWLYRIARNTVTSYQRKALRRRGIARWFVLGAAGHGEVASAGARTSDGEDDEVGGPLLELREGLGKLTPAQREVVILRFFVGLGTGEIAHALGKEAKAVYALEARALEALRRHMT